MYKIFSEITNAVNNLTEFFYHEMAGEYKYEKVFFQFLSWQNRWMASDKDCG